MSDGKPYPIRLARAESFLGIHFDFHATADCAEIGAHTTREMIAAIVEQVQPDYIQCDCKGHPGYSSYPTRVGYPAPGVVADALRIWREVTAERGVALYLHYSGVWDTEALKHHPDWARIDENGKRDPDKTSVVGPYVDELLIPQLSELAGDYGMDGVWVDGECWATVRDYSPAMLEAFRQETGITAVPRQPEDPHFYAFTEFCREAFRRYVRHYVDTLHARYPAFQITSNWAYSSTMPEPVTIDIDYLSGDTNYANSVNAARFEGRCLARQGRPWDLMAWSFWSDRTGQSCSTTKSSIQLKQEAAIILALGGGFQAYFNQRRDGSPPLWLMPLMADVARFCRERQAICHRAEAVPQVALLYAGKAFYRYADTLFGSWYAPEIVPLKGVLQSLLDAQEAVEITMEHHLAGRMADYPLIVVPEWEYLDPAFIDELRAYVRGGGNLLLLGPRAAALFAPELQVQFMTEVQKGVRRWLAQTGAPAQGSELAGLMTDVQPVILSSGATPWGKLYDANDPERSALMAGSIARYGAGRIAATYFTYGQAYAGGAIYRVRDYIHSLVRELFPKPMVEVEGSHAVDVTVNRLGQRLTVNLVNTAGPHADAEVHSFADIPPVGPLQVTIRCGARPKRVTLQPEGKRLDYAFSEGEIVLTLPRLELHEIIVIE
jgi:hypothetical protein